MSRTLPAGKRGRPRRHPGAALRGHMEYAGITGVALSAATGYSRKHISALVNGRANFDAQSAIKIARATGTQPKLWLNMQAAYDIQQAELELADWEPLSEVA